MDRVEQVKVAKDFLKKLAQGINPVTNEPVSDGDVINNVRVSRCMFFVAEILDEYVAQQSSPATQVNDKRVASIKKEFVFDNAMISDFPYSDADMYLTEFIDNVKSLAIKYNTVALPRRAFVNWLLDSKIYETHEYMAGGNVRTTKRATQAGIDVGIYNGVRNGMYGVRDVVLISRMGQEFLMDNLPSIAAHFRENRKVGLVNAGHRWTDEEEKVLIDMYKSGMKISDIAKKLQRKRGGVRARLKKLGFINAR